MADSSRSTNPDSQSHSSVSLTRMLAHGHGRPLALIFLVLLITVQSWVDSAQINPVRTAIFDFYQRLKPRQEQLFSVAIVAIDEASLQRYGQWPWPRTQLAKLLERTAALQPHAIALDILFVEPDRVSPAYFVQTYPLLDQHLKQQLEGLPSTDEIFAKAMARYPIVVGRVGINDSDVANTGAKFDAAPQIQFVIKGPDPSRRLLHFQRQLSNLAAIDQASHGLGFVNTLHDPDGIVRRIPLVMVVDGQIVPALALELLRVSIKADRYTIHCNESGIKHIQINNIRIPTDADGAISLYFSPSDARRRFSAVRVLEKTLPEIAFDNKVALIGVTGIGLTDASPTPIAPLMDGVEIQAQVFENILVSARLTRPANAITLETSALLLAAMVLIVLIPYQKPSWSFIALGILLALLFSTSYAAFANARFLLDPSYPAAGVTLIFIIMLVVAWIESDHERKALTETLEAERLEKARIAGELSAARKIQMGILPNPNAILGLPENIDVHAFLEPAREVGGDLYDVFMLDRHRLFFVVGDVSGKGVPASLFMALSKALCRSSARRVTDSVDALIATANEEISSENPAEMYVTVVAGILDTRTGALDFCIAGHASPYLIRPGTPPRTLDSDGGPPLCYRVDFPYPVEQTQMQAGDILLLITDGVTDAQTRNGGMYGNEGVQRFLAALPPGANPQEIVEGLYSDIQNAGDAKARAVDDIAIMAIQFRGPSAGAQTQL